MPGSMVMAMFFFSFEIALLDGRQLVDFHADPVAQRMPELLAVPGLRDDVPRYRVKLSDRDAGPDRPHCRFLRLLHHAVNLLKGGVNAMDEHGSCQV